MKRYYGTYFDRNYLAKAIALIESLNQYEKNEFQIFAVCLDEICRTILTKLKLANVTLIPLHQIEQNDIALSSAKQNRSLVEYYWTLTPTIILRLLDRYPEIDVLTYVDADLFFYSSPNPIFEELDDKSVLIHEHRFSPALTYLEENGIYNVGLLSFRNDNDGYTVLNWWRDRCLEWCYSHAEDGKMGDQGYLNDWPTRFGNVVVLQNLGAGVAPWNHDQYTYSVNYGQVYVNESPLIFYHFHSFIFVDNDDIVIPAKHNTYNLTTEILHLIFTPYLEVLHQAILKIRAIVPDFSFGLKNHNNISQQLTLLIRREFLTTLKDNEIPLNIHVLNETWMYSDTSQVREIPNKRKDAYAADRAAVNYTNTKTTLPEFDNKIELCQAPPLVSAIVSTYNSERFIRGCLQDLVNQTLYQRGKLEIIVIDSNSLQNERAIVDEFQQRYNNIFYLRTEEREGIYAAWNRGIKKAQGKYITNANTDDRHRRDALEILANALDNHLEAALVYGDVFVTNYENQTFESHIRCGYHLRPDYSADVMLTGCHMGPQPMWRKSVHNVVGYFDENYLAAGDYEFWCRIAKDFPMKHIPQFLGLYFENPKGFTNSDLSRSAKEAQTIRQTYFNSFPLPLANKRYINNYQFQQYIPPYKYVNICLITYNRLTFTQASIEGILKFTHYPHVITVVDNGSTDGTREYLTKIKSEGLIKNLILLPENVGIAKASNLAWHLEPEAEYYLKLDNDIVIQKPNWLANMVAVLENVAQVGMVGYNFEPQSYPVTNVEGYDLRLTHRSLGGACLLIPKRTQQALGYWCEDYGLYGEEDADYGYRVKLKGGLNVYMEDQNIGLHLPAGKAAAIDPRTLTAQDGIEEVEHSDYRYWKDAQRRHNVQNGHFYKNIRAYELGHKPLYVASKFAADWLALDQNGNSKSLPEDIKISIIIPVFNKVDFTQRCLDAIKRHTTQANIEIIVVDNASTDQTPTYLRTSRQGHLFKVLTNAENLGFAKACNQGARAASGQYLLFLNNDTEVQPGWLEPLVEILNTAPEVAVVGSKLLFPNGKIQHAGVVLVRDDVLKININPCHLGYNHPDISEFNQLKRVKAVTAACMLVRKNVFNDIDGFDEAYWNGYEDVDFCFKVTKAGYDIIYQPASVVTHFESQSGPERRVKENLNLQRLQEKWQSTVMPEFVRLAMGKIVPFLSSTIVIVTYNSAESIRACLESVIKHTPVTTKIIVVDNASTDQTRSILGEFDHRIIPILNPENLGFSAASNQGIRATQSDYVVLLNPDTIVTPGWLAKLLSHFTPKVGAVGPVSDYVAGLQKIQLYLSKNHPQEYTLETLLALLDQNRERSVETKLLIGFCMALSRKALDDIGCLDEELFLGNDDLDISWRLRLANYKLLVATDTFVHHQGQVSFKTVNQSKTDALVQQSTDKLYAKLIAHYGEGNVPPPTELWGINWFTPTNARFRQAQPDKSIKVSEPLTSIIILTHNQLNHTKLCLQSIEQHTYEPHELIIVDNGSTDSTVFYLRDYVARRDHVRLIENPDNRGFAAGNNQGLAMAGGNYVMLLNNDTIVTANWLSQLLTVMEQRPEVGLVGPMSNYVSGPQQVPNTSYTTLEEMHHFARQWAAANAGQSIEFIRLVGFCLLARREVIERIGGLDEQFGSGNFEDDDFCLRAAAAGFKARIVQDAFIHHTGGQTFKSAGIDYQRSLERNWQLFKSKWQLPAHLPYGTDYRPYLKPVDPTQCYIPLPIGATDAETTDQSLTLPFSQTQPDKYKPIGDTMAHDGILAQMIASAQVAGRWQQAISLLQEAVKYAPPGQTQAALWNSLGYSLFQTKQPVEAEAAFQEGLRSEPQNMKLLKNLIELYRQQEQLDKATEYINQGLRINPDDIEILLSLGECAIQLGIFDVAEMTFVRVKALAPDTAGIDEILAELFGTGQPSNGSLNGTAPSDDVSIAQEKTHQVLAKGQAALNANDLAGAAQEFAWVVAQYPNLAAGHMALGSALLALGRVEAAITPLRRVVELLPELPAGYNQLGVAYYRTGHQTEAETVFKQAHQLDSLDLEPCLNLIDLYRGQRHFEKAQVMVKVALSINANHIEVQIAAGLVNAEMGNFGEAGHSLTKLEGIAPTHPGVAALRSLLNNQTNQTPDLIAQVETAQAAGNWPQAITLLKAILIQPGHQADPALWNSLGISHFHAGQITEAETVFVHGLKFNPKDLELLSNLADLYLNQEQFDQATEYLNRALQVNPNDVNVLLSLGNCCIQLNVFDTALMAFQRVQALAPETEGINEVINQLELMEVGALEAVL